ncbi:ATP-binding protein [Actinomarinicola tropica]|uniref:Tetratricopeptide repeat protein n=1 Tax=Actinomarinicola tropica TaxID=2789776 RepID=A0A5Q2RHJ5_9ACTN|nr:hypothetical protein [Actinomarinicola tropica]QGG96318.1 hypothetical protein GH723_15105 [Actinomarinicola tropica]
MEPEDEAARALQEADAAYARMDLAGVVAHLSTAIRARTASGDVRGAALACARLGDAYGSGMGNLTAARAWFARARRLVEDEPPCIEQGWVAVAAMGCDVDDPDVLLASAELALDRARRFGDVNLEAKALADGGLAHVRAGRIEQGMAQLDEAMALACGPVDDAEVAAKSVCSFFTACQHSSAVDRAESWVDLLRRRGLIGPDPGAPIFLSSHCESLRATVMVEQGRWGEAEALLLDSVAAFEEAMGMPAWHPRLALADLRTRQGRPAEAEELLLGLDQTVDALVPLARLHLERGDHDLARRAAVRGLRMVGDDRLRAVELLAVVVDAQVAAGDGATALRTCGDLARRLDGIDVPALRARASAARARALAATGATTEAVVLLEEAVDQVAATRLPFLELTLLLRLAALREEAGALDAAREDAAMARSIVSGLDVVLRPGELDLLDRLAGAGRPAPRRSAALTAVGGRWCVTAGATTVLLPRSKGLAYLSQLLQAPGVERHALDLVDRVEGVAEGLDRRRLGDAGELIDARSRAAYRTRIESLRSEIEDALECGALDDAEQMQSELDALVGQLASAFGLGGRARRAGSVAERARLNVTRALRSAIARISDALPEDAAVLDRRVRTGLYCAYEPGLDDPVLWRTGPVQEVFDAD